MTLVQWLLNRGYRGDSPGTTAEANGQAARRDPDRLDELEREVETLDERITQLLATTAGADATTGDRRTQSVEVEGSWDDVDTGFVPAVPTDQQKDPSTDQLVGVPDSLAAELVVFEWLSSLVSTAGPAGAFRALRHYESIGWLGPSVRERLEDVLAEPSLDADVDPHEPAELTTADHGQSHEFLRTLRALGRPTSEPGQRPVVTRPFIDTVPRESTSTMLRWAHYLGSTFGTGGALAALRYYERLGWLTPAVRAHLEDAIHGLSLDELHTKKYDEPVTLDGPLSTFSGTPFSPHLRSLQFVANVVDADLSETLLRMRLVERREAVGR